MSADPLTLALLAGGTGMQMMSQQDQDNRRREKLNRQFERNDQLSNQSSKMVLDEADNFDPTNRRTAMQEQETKNFDASMADLQAGAGGALGAVQTSGDAGNVSEDFIKAKAGRAATEGQRITDIAKDLSKTRAPAQLQFSDAQRRGSLASSLQDMYTRNQNMSEATKQDMRNVEDSGLGDLGSLASQVALMNLTGGKKKPVPVDNPADTSGIEWA
ncbi:hypothetical protein [Rhodoferax mekongensis]|uniref:hypothetical protein n=1 Tax=Rhodoferax mekongensis TaxID=3068341 RepID=UPI0028BD2468|nr:hypothetical protein [Rhodoferax sp. TBRC 17199]MDT7514685.1 hypothetical protein [Rhodoferax sp. TBRC 17199]